MLIRIKRKLQANKKKNSIILFVSFFLINLIALGYSALQQNLMITGEVNYVSTGGNRLYDVLKNEALNEELAVEYTGTHQDAVDGSGTKKIYHYYATTNAEGTSILNKNNVIFGNQCWQMIRTTDTGGVRMIYNGEAVNNQCLSTRGTHIGYSASTSKDLSSQYYYGTDYTYNSTTGYFFLSGNIVSSIWSNASYQDLVGKYTCMTSSATIGCTELLLVEEYSSATNAFVLSIKANANYDNIGVSPLVHASSGTANTYGYSNGYMYKKKYYYGTYSYSNTSTTSSDAYKFKFSSSFTYDGTNYTLVSSSNSLGAEGQYTCYSKTATTCSTIYYILHKNPHGGLNSGYTNVTYALLTDGDSAATMEENLFSASDINQKDSTIKFSIDKWYEKNLLGYEDYLDYSIYCNNRVRTSNVLYNIVYTDRSRQKNLSCNQLTDRFSVLNNSAKLTYSIALATTPELDLLNNNNARTTTSSSYLMTPYNETVNDFLKSDGGFLEDGGSYGTNTAYGVRPVITLNYNTTYTSGLGTQTAPYIVNAIPLVGKIEFRKNEISLAVNSTYELEAHIIPENATNSTITWVSSDNNVATVDSNGIITGVSIGRTTITATAGGFSASVICNVEAEGNFKDDSWSTIINNVRSNHIGLYHVGDTKEVDMGTLGVHTVRIANISSPNECKTANFSQTACGFVLEFADIITTHNMNGSETNTGRWPATAMRTYVNNTIYNALPADLKEGIIDTFVGSESGYTSTDKLYLLTGVEIWGEVWNNSDKITTSITRQLDYYKELETTKTNYTSAIKKASGTASNWWLRTSYGNLWFFYTKSDGSGSGTSADDAEGVSPAFRIGTAFERDSLETIVNNAKSGNLSSYNVGDTKMIKIGTLGNHILRIANKSTPAECSNSDYSQTACGFVLEFADVITTHNMNSSATSVGGWPASSMRTYLNNTIYTELPTVLREAIINTSVISGYESGASSNYNTIDKIYLLSYSEIFGENADNDTVKMTNTRQLDYYFNQQVTSLNYDLAKKEKTITSSAWWLRSAQNTNTSSFYEISSVGSADYVAANSTIGVSPAFRIGNHPFETDSWSTIINNVKDNNTNMYEIGSTKEVDMGALGVHTVRIANISSPNECKTANFSQTACGFVLEFADIITTHNMNGSETNTGRWPATAMRTYVNNTIYNALPADLKEGIIDTFVGSESGYTSTDKLYLLTGVEIWGEVWNNSDKITTSITRQLDYYKELETTKTNYTSAIKKASGTASNWWLRTSYGNLWFFYTKSDGSGSGTSADDAEGVSPAFRLG